ncbi:MAG: type II toxin-antitoxin system VapC family toxin [Bacteroidia bacterium]
MQFLLDTHTFIWYAEGSKQLSDQVKQIISGPDLCYISIATIWEIAIKTSLGKLSLPNKIESFVEERISGAGLQVIKSRIETHISSSKFTLLSS